MREINIHAPFLCGNLPRLLQDFPDTYEPVKQDGVSKTYPFQIHTSVTASRGQSSPGRERILQNCINIFKETADINGKFIVESETDSKFLF
jgi:hypothetical protein